MVFDMEVKYIKCMDEEKPTEGEIDVLVKDPVVCPKCKKDISNGKFEINSRDFLITMISASIFRLGKLCKSKPKLYTKRCE